MRKFVFEDSMKLNKKIKKKNCVKKYEDEKENMFGEYFE